jgi:hypothetical protein
LGVRLRAAVGVGVWVRAGVYRLRAGVGVRVGVSGRARVRARVRPICTPCSRWSSPLARSRRAAAVACVASALDAAPGLWCARSSEAHLGVGVGVRVRG